MSCDPFAAPAHCRRKRKGIGADALISGGAGAFTGAAMHTPVVVTDQARRIVEELDADCLIAVGGGSTTGLGRALAVRTGMPQIGDTVFGVKDELVLDSPEHKGPAPDGRIVDGPWHRLDDTFRLAPAE
ncbi:iron-containing alcohol dehydrogenase [Streptomyces sp. 5K101]|uniref:iron-containing alcohol dehydrogenase n=1 Tax=Streptomyces sp. 5K101 TaxID=3390037 RepID=UPI0039762C0B